MVTVLYLDNRQDSSAKSLEPAADAGIQVERANSPEQAREMLENEIDGLDAVLLAWEPRDGTESIEDTLAAATAADLKVVVVVPKRRSEGAEVAIDAGAFWVVTAPGDTFHLQRVLKAAVETAEILRDKEQIHRDREVLVDLLGAGTFRFRTPKEARVLAEWFGSRCNEPQASVGVLELMINAIEHGNLGLTYTDKSTLLAQGLFEHEVEKRLAAPEYRDRLATVAVDRRPGSLDLLITDTGPGFDFERYLTMDNDRILDPHGRGILMANIALKVEFLPPGNRVKINLPLDK